MATKRKPARKRKATRSPAQRAATARMLAANKAKRLAPRINPKRRAARKRSSNPRRPAPRVINPNRHTVRHVHTTVRKHGKALNLFHLTSTAPAKAAGGQVWKLPAALVKSKDFQAWAYGMGYVVSTTLIGLRQRLQRFMR